MASRKKTLTARVGMAVAKNGPGLMKKLGRVTKTAAVKGGELSKEFAKGFRAGWREA